MKTLALSMMLASAAALVSSFAFAQAPAAPAGAENAGKRAAQARERLKDADKNGDGKISREEAAASMPNLARHFDKIDTNKDGQISRDEMKAWRNQQGDRQAASK